MSATGLRAGLIGATGLVGQAVLEQLLADPACTQLRVWARRDSSRTDTRLDWQLCDFERLAETADCSGLDVVFCCLGTTTAKAGKAGLEKVDLAYVHAIAQAARAAGVSCFCVISSIGANASSPVHYSRTKGRMEAALRALEFPSLQIIRPSLLLGERPDNRPGEALGQKLAPLLNRLLCGPLQRYRAISAGDVASAMIELGKNATPGQRIHHLPLE